MTTLYQCINGCDLSSDCGRKVWERGAGASEHYCSTSALSWSSPPPLNFVFITIRRKIYHEHSKNRSRKDPLIYKMPPVIETSVHSPEETQKLNDVIDSTTPARLRALLKDLSKKTSDNWEHIRSELMLQPGALKRVCAEMDEDSESEGSGQAESDYSDEQTEAPASRQRFEICEQCNKEYDTLLNDKITCIWHAGEPKIPKSDA